MYVCGEASPECCAGALLWFGFRTFPQDISNMFSADSPSPGSMRIKSSTEVCQNTLRSMGRMVPLGRYIITQPLESIHAETNDVRSILCFGNAAQLRDLGALVHFGDSRAYSAIMAPWGSGCAIFVSYPSGMAMDAPKDTAFLGPMTPEAEGWLPEDTLALALPIDLAIRMAEGFERSFAARR